MKEKRTREYRALEQERIELALCIAHCVTENRYSGPAEHAKRFVEITAKLAELRIAAHDREHGVDPRTAYNDEG